MPHGNHKPLDPRENCTTSQTGSFTTLRVFLLLFQATRNVALANEISSECCFTLEVLISDFSSECTLSPRVLKSVFRR